MSEKQYIDCGCVDTIDLTLTVGYEDNTDERDSNPPG